MIEHVVLFKLKPEIESSKIDWMMRETRMRLLKIPSVLGLRCGFRNASKAGWAFFLLVELESEEKLSNYLKNPKYLRFMKEVITPNVTRQLAIDFDTNIGTDPLLS